MRKQTEGNEQQRRRAARDARARGRSASEVAATTGASKQDHHVRRKQDHAAKLETLREGKQQERHPQPRPGSR
jgi:hypothetical protein